MGEKAEEAILGVWAGDYFPTYGFPNFLDYVDKVF